MIDSSFYRNALDSNDSLSPKAVGWDSVERAELRYRLVAEYVRSCASTWAAYVVDFGCGLGAFDDYLVGPYKYLGIDGMPEYIEEAKKLRTQTNFSVGSLTEVPKCNIIVCIGTYSLRGSYPDFAYKKYFEESVKELLEKADRMVVVTGLHTSVDGEFLPHLYYHNLKDLIKLASDLGVKLKLDFGISKYEFIAVFVK